MKIYTSYFSKGKKLTDAGIKMIGIALKPPTWYYGVTVHDVAPTPSILYGANTEEEYTRRFRAEVLARVNARAFVDKITQMSQGHDIALCCYEKPGDFCHRHIVAEWLKEQLGIEVDEYGVSKQPQPIELDLFANAE